MAIQDTPQSGNTEYLPWGIRIFTGAMSLLLLVYSIVLAYEPPVRRSNERDWKGAVVKRVAADADATTLSIAVLTVAAILIFFALNGVRVHEVSWGKGTASSKPQKPPEPDKGTVEKLQPDAELAGELAAQVPQPATQGRRMETKDGETFAVFDLSEIPAQVLADTILNWPQDNSARPTTLESFEYAIRKPGKGNHPWVVYFRSRRPVRVSYGGQGKLEPTVTAV